ncbi:MAG: CatB-related O-acetyltransferase [Oceanobacter sp.]
MHNSHVDSKFIDYRKSQTDDFRALGCVISPSAILSEKLKLCIPIHVSPRAQIKPDCSIDRYTFINWDTILYPNVHIGSYCSIGRGVEIGLAKHPVNWLSTHTFQYSPSHFPGINNYVVEGQKHRMHHKTEVGHDVWIGNGAKIMSGIKIGSGAVIGAGAVVTKDVAPYSIVGGIPGKVIGERFEAETVNRLLCTQWWKLDHSFIQKLPTNDINESLNKVESYLNQKT